MTSIAETDRQTGWRGRLVWIALALSLTLNVFFVGGLAWMKLSTRPNPTLIERMQHIAQALNLTDDQRGVFEQFVRAARQHGRSLRESNQPLLERIWVEMAKPTPDDDAVTKLSSEVDKNRQAFQQELAAGLQNFIKTLSPEQRAKLAEITKAGGDPPTRRLFEIIAP